jgi:hypothetical protein
MSDNIGFKMRKQMGFEVFINKGGAISIKQNDFYNQEMLIVLSRSEAEILQSCLSDLIDGCSDELTNIEANSEGEENGRVRDVLEKLPQESSQSGSPQSLEANRES